MMMKNTLKTDTVNFSAESETTMFDSLDLSGILGALSLAGLLTACSPDTATQPVSPIATTPPVVTAPITTKTIDTPLSVWHNGVDYYKSGMYSVINNVWGLQGKKLVHNVDYFQRATFNPDNLQTGVKFQWDFPQQLQDQQGSVVYAFPSVAWGNPLPLTGWENKQASLVQIKNINTFSQTYDIKLTGETQYLSILHDMWIFDANGLVSGEIAFFSKPDEWTMYWTHPNNYFGKIEGATTYVMNLDGVDFNVLVTKMHSPDQPNHNKPAYMITPVNGEQITSGTIDWKKVLDFLVKTGTLNEDHYIRGVEMGAEIHMGDAEMLINDFTITMTAIDPMTNNLYTFG